MKETLYTDLIAKYLSGNIEALEREQLWAWVESDAANRRFFDQMVQLWRASNVFEEEKYETDTPQAWSKLETRLFSEATDAPIIEKTPTKIVRLSNKKTWWAAAAILLVLVVASIWIYKQPDENQVIVYQTINNQKQLYFLPDSSKIWLNENTRLTFDSLFEERIVQLEGEAFFEVTHLEGKPFTIQSGGATTTVLGTKFNVRAYPTENNVKVTVKTGEVRLEDAKNEKDTVLLKKNDVGIFDKKTERVARVKEIAAENADAWQTQRLEFKNTPMREVIPTLEHTFGIQFKVEDSEILNYPFTDTRNTLNLKEVIDAIEYSMPVKVEKQDSVYVIRRKY